MNTTNNEEQKIGIGIEAEQNIVIRPHQSTGMKIAGETPLYKLLVNNVEASTQLMELTKIFQDDVRRETVEACKEVLKDYFSGLAIMAFPEHSLKSILTNLDTISHEETH